MLGRPTVAEISLANFRYNLQNVRKLLGPKTKLMAVVKANAYGHGLIPIALEAQKSKIDYLGVACLSEALEIRESKNSLPILVLGYTDNSGLKAAVDHNIDLNIMEEKLLKELDKITYSKNKAAKIHIKVNTGMNRLGIKPEECIHLLSKIRNLKNIKVAGVFSHFATADEKDLSFARFQLETFRRFTVNCELKTVDYHIANSAATLRLPEAHLDMVRLGKILYGTPPSLDFKMPFIPKPVMTLKTKIIQMHELSKNEYVGYGRTFKAKSKTLVATIPLGYADGFRRAPNNFGRVLVNNEFAPIIGRISMDQASIDVTKIPNVQIGDEVIILGQQGKKEITTWDIASQIGTIPYEVVTSITSRVPRIYI